MFHTCNKSILKVVGVPTLNISHLNCFLIVNSTKYQLHFLGIKSTSQTFQKRWNKLEQWKAWRRTDYLASSFAPNILNKHFQTPQHGRRDRKRNWKREEEQQGEMQKGRRKSSWSTQGPAYLALLSCLWYASTCWYYLARSSWWGVGRGFHCDQAGASQPPLSGCFGTVTHHPTSVPSKKESLS